MTRSSEFTDDELRALMRATDVVAPLSPAREAALHARIVAQGAPWLALQAEGAEARADAAQLDALATRIARASAPLLAHSRRAKRPLPRRATLVDIAVRWSRPAVPLAIAAGLGAMMVLARTPRPADVVVAASDMSSDVSSAYAAMDGNARAGFSETTPEAAVGAQVETP